jgi:prepilin-type N-terminal cleavage/methylation domain-containing protein
MKKSLNKGFTLLEVLLVVAILGILAAIVIVAINPNKQLASARNAQRQSDVNTILNAVYQYAIDNNGTIPASITTNVDEVCITASCTNLVDLGVLTDNETYLVAIPQDPTGSSTNGGGYEIVKTANNRVTVSAPDAEDGAVIEVTR